MSWDYILNLKDDKLLRTLLILLVFLSPGLTLILIFYNSYIFSLDSIKIILLSIAFSTPNMFASLIYYLITERKSLRKGINITVWLGLSLVIFYTHLFFFLIGSYFTKTLEFNLYWLIYFLVILVLSILSFYEGRKNNP
jgi:hypothetical protein